MVKVNNKDTGCRNSGVFIFNFEHFFDLEHVKVTHFI